MENRYPFGEDREDAMQNDRPILERVSVSWFVLLFGSYALAVAGAFSPETVLVLAVSVVLGALVSLRKLRPSRELAVIGGLLTLFMTLTFFPAVPSVFSGRDQGSYAEAAIRLAREHSLLSNIPAVSRDFFQLYGKGQALNFPGFFYRSDGTLETQFPLGYIAWIAANELLFKIAGISIANVFTMFLSTITLFLLLRRFVGFPFAAGGVAITALSFPLVWIADNALSENLALVLFLLVSFHLVSFLKNPSPLSWWLVIFGSVFLFLTRVEGFFVFAVALLLTASYTPSRQYLKAHIFSTVLPALVFAVAFFCSSLVFSLPFYRTVGKALLESFFSSSGNASFGIPLFSPLLRNAEIFWTYGIISVFALAALGIVFLLSRRKFLQLTPFFLAMPTFFYLVSPHISSDHPWMLRRFAFSVWPTVGILAVFAIAQLQESFSEKYPKKIAFRPALFSLFFSSLLILPGIPAIAPIFFFSENENLLTDVETLSKNFSKRDLILVDRLASGDPYSMIADPMSTLFGLNAVYFFNPEDILRLDRSRYENVYLVVRNGDELPYRVALGNRFSMQAVRLYTLHASILTRETNPLILPVKKYDTVSGTVFLLVPK